MRSNDFGGGYRSIDPLLVCGCREKQRKMLKEAKEKGKVGKEEEKERLRLEKEKEVERRKNDPLSK